MHGAEGDGMSAVRGTQKVPVTWQYITLKAPLKAQDPGSEAAMIIPAGTVIRLYTGVVGYANDDKSNPIKSPNSKGFSLIETLPDKQSIYWNFYKDEPQYEGLLNSLDYAKREQARLEHLWMAQVPMSDGEYKDTLVSNAMSDYYDKLNVSGVEIPKPDEGGGGGGGGGEGGGGGGGGGDQGGSIVPMLLIGAVVGAAIWAMRRGVGL